MYVSTEEVRFGVPGNEREWDGQRNRQEEKKERKLAKGLGKRENNEILS
jgi:hypothetical protein